MHLVLKRYNPATNQLSEIDFFESWYEAIKRVNDAKYNLMNNGFQIKTISNTKFEAWNPNTRLCYYVTPA